MCWWTDIQAQKSIFAPRKVFWQEFYTRELVSFVDCKLVKIKSVAKLTINEYGIDQRQNAKEEKGNCK